MKKALRFIQFAFAFPFFKGPSVIDISVENLGCISSAENDVVSKRSKHIDIRVQLTMDTIRKGSITLSHTSTENMIADTFTLPLLKSKLAKFITLFEMKPENRNETWRFNQISTNPYSTDLSWEGMLDNYIKIQILNLSPLHLGAWHNPQLKSNIHWICSWCSQEKIQVILFQILGSGIVKVSGLESSDFSRIFFGFNNT